MIQGLLWITGSYGLCIAMVHLSYAWFHGIKNHSRHYVLITHNNQLQVEWYIRSLLFYSLIKGKDIKITILDEGSDDETLAIIRRLTLHRYVEINRLKGAHEFEHFMSSLMSEEVIFIPLRNQEDHRKIPLFQ